MRRFLLASILVLALGWAGSCLALDKLPSGVTSTFSRSAASMGVWKGRVHGRGMIGLRLLIMRDGHIESSRYLGKVKLVRADSSSFTFTTSVPRDTSWSWKLLAIEL